MRKLLTITFTTLFSVAPLQSVEITHRVTVQPIIVYSGEESANPTAELFEAETDKILAQAGIDVHFKSVVTVTNSLYFDLSSDIRHPNSLHSLAQSSGNGASADPSVLNLWFVNSIDNNPGAMGFALQSSMPFGILRPKNGAAISKYALAWNNGAGMRDIVAHELCHNLGLYHGLDESGVIQATGQLNLMSRTSSFPRNSDDITPHGAGLSELNLFQITRLLSMFPFVIPLPVTDRYEYSPAVTPTAPGSLVGKALSSSEIELIWMDNSIDENGFRIYRSIDGMNFYEIASVPANATYYKDKNLTDATEYLYEVVAFNLAGESAIAGVTVETLPIPSAHIPPLRPGWLVASLTGLQEITLTWVDRSEDESSFVVERSTNGKSFEVIETLQPDSCSYKDETLNPEQIYYYRVRAHNSAGASLYSNVSFNKTRPYIPAVPEQLIALTTNRVAYLNWTPVAGAKWYRLQRAEKPGSFVTIRVTTETNFVDSSVMYDTTYQYLISALNVSGESDASDVVEIRPEALPLRPGWLVASAPGPNLIRLDWVDRSENESGFQIERSTDGEIFIVVSTIAADEELFIDQNLPAGHIFYYRLKAFNGSGFSQTSNVSRNRTKTDQ